MSADVPGMSEPHDPRLDHLFRALTAGGSADELAGQDAALTMFRVNRRRPRRRLRFASPLGMAAAVTVIVGGLTGAAYAEVLPAPVQHMAYRLLDRIGVPDAHLPAPSSSAHPAAAPAPSGAPAPAAATCPCQAGQPGAGTARNLVLTAAYAQIPSYGDDVLSGLLASGGQPEPGVRVRLFEHADGRLGWRLAGSATTDRSGEVTVAVRHLTSNASFRLIAPGGTASTAVLITVIPPVYLHVTASPRAGTDILTARARFADVGDAVVLQELSGTVWSSIDERVLGWDHRAFFTVLVPRSGDRVYRVVLLPTAAHGSSVSGQVRVVSHRIVPAYTDPGGRAEQVRRPPGSPARIVRAVRGRLSP